MLRPLICERCGAPLPRPSEGSRYVTCAFCDTTSALEVGGVAPQPAAPQTWVERKRKLQGELDAFEREYKLRVEAGAPPYDAFRAAAASALARVCDADAISNVTFALAADLEQRSEARVVADPIVLMRLATGYLDVSERLSSEREVVLNLPFITATPSGPVHFEKPLSVAILTELAARPPALPARKPGFWKRLFG